MNESEAKSDSGKSYSKLRAKNAFIFAFLGAIGQVALFMFGHYAAIASWGTTFFLFWNIILVIPLFLLCLIIFPVSLIFIRYKKDKKLPKFAAIVTFGLLLLTVPSVIVGQNIGYKIRLHAFVQLGHRLQPLIESIQQFEIDNGHPPKNLNELVPDYISSIPTTGMKAYPQIVYKTWPKESEDDVDTWSLDIPCPVHQINWDEFKYWPSHDYPYRDLGGFYQKVSEWAYYHE